MADDWFDAGGSGNRVDVGSLLDSDTVHQAFTDMLDAGALVSLGTTSDGGALGVTVTVDGRWRREYFRDTDELVVWLAEALPAVRSACEAASSARQKRPRSARAR